MSMNTVDAKLLQKLFLAGAKSIEANKEYINELNVFPVPDGDTGTNMSLTIMAAAKDVSQLDNPNMQTLAKAISSGSLRGARGNSGVILSQLFRGFCKVVRDYEELNVTVLANVPTGEIVLKKYFLQLSKNKSFRQKCLFLQKSHLLCLLMV